jgi:peptide/nickel transport system substrate-binding protein
MTASDLPGTDTILALGQGGEGLRFVGFQIYETLTAEDLTQSTTPPTIKGVLAESWTMAPDVKTYTFKLRQGVKFQDGTPWNADAAIFNFQRYMDKSFQYYYPAVAGVAGLVDHSIATYKKVDDATIELVTSTPYAFLPQDLSLLPMASPTAVKAVGNDAFKDHPIGTGPYAFKSQVRGQNMTLVRNDTYWRGKPSLDKIVLRPIPDPTARVAALKSGEVNWAEAVNPSDISGLTGSGFQILTNPYSQQWRCTLDYTKTPWNIPEVRQAANFALDRATMVGSILKNTAVAAYQAASPVDPGYDASLGVYSFDQAKAKDLLSKAGYPNGFDTTLTVPTSGSGNMVPVPMAEQIQSDLAKVGIRIKVTPMDWTTLNAEQGAGKMPGGADMSCWATTLLIPGFWGIWFGSTSPGNVNHVKNATADALLAKVPGDGDPATLASDFKTLNKTLTADGAWLFVANDKNPRALAKTVHGFVDPQSWFANLTTVTVS